ncbi:MAG: glycosyltransferase [bacterium]
MRIYFIDFERKYHNIKNLENGLKRNGVKVCKIVYPDLISTFLISINGGILHINWPEYFYKMGRGGIKLFPSLILGLSLVISLFIAKCLFGIKLVFSLHNLMPHGEHRRWLDKFVYTSIFYLAYKVVCHCDTAVLLVRKLYRFCYKKIRVIPLPNYGYVYGDRIEKHSARVKLNLELDAYIYLCFGKIREYKSIEILIDCFKGVCGEKDRLIIVGSDDSSGFADTLRLRCANDNRIIIRNEWITDDMVPLYFSSADCLVMPYSEVLTSGPVLLSAQYQLPLVAPYIGCIPEQTEERMSILYNEGGLSSALISIKGFDLRDIEDGCKSVMTKTSLQVVAKKMIEEIYV